MWGIEPPSSFLGIGAQIGLVHGASDEVEVRGERVQGEEDKVVGREQENGEEKRSHMYMITHRTHLRKIQQQPIRRGRKN